MKECNFCGEELVGRQRKFCSTRHKVLWKRYRPSAPMVYKFCLQCGKQIEKSESAAGAPKKYCSPLCGNKAANDRNSPDYKIPEIEIECHHCAKPFTITDERTRFCSDSCKHKHVYYSSNIRSKTKPKPTDRICCYCHNEYRGLLGTKFCSDQCHHDDMVSHHGKISQILSRKNWVKGLDSYGSVIPL